MVIFALVLRRTDRRTRWCATVKDLQWTKWVQSSREELYWYWMWMSCSPCDVIVLSGALHREQRELSSVVFRYNNREHWWHWWQECLQPPLECSHRSIRRSTRFSSKHRRGTNGQGVLICNDDSGERLVFLGEVLVLMVIGSDLSLFHELLILSLVLLSDVVFVYDLRLLHCCKRAPER